MHLWKDYEATGDMPVPQFLLVCLLQKKNLYHVMIELDYLACVHSMSVIIAESD